jgi:DNA-binding beta-propeller fold protein YncE
MLANIVLLLAGLTVQSAGEAIISTAAGTGEKGFGGDGGPAIEARLNQPFDLTIDSRGNVFFSDTFNHRIRKIERRTGLISTVAGTGTAGFVGDGGPATSAQLNEPYGVVIDARGNLFLADRLNRRVRKVDGGTGILTTVAGNGSMTYSGDFGPAQQAGLVEPNGVAIDPEGRSLYIADVAGHRIRKVELATGIISTFAGTGKGHHDGDDRLAELASIWGARAVDVATDGTVFILEREGNTLRTVHPRTGLIHTLAGAGGKGYSGDGGPALSATFNGPKELAVDRSGNLWIVDTENHAIRFIDKETGTVRTVAGVGTLGVAGDGGPASRAHLDRPHGVAIGPDHTIWIADTNNNRIRVIRPGLP